MSFSLGKILITTKDNVIRLGYQVGVAELDCCYSEPYVLLDKNHPNFLSFWAELKLIY